MADEGALAGEDMKTIIWVGVLLLSLPLLSSCSKFNKSNFYTDAFGFNLNPEIVGKENEYTDGLLILHGVKDTDAILVKVFQNGSEKGSGYIPVFHFGKEIGSADWGETQYKTWKSFDGYTPMAVYYPRMKILLLGYFDGFGG